MATYPSGIYSYTNRSGTQTLLAGTHSTTHNEASAEIIAIETELGTNPKGIYVNVGDRLDALTALIGTQHTQNTDSGTTNATFYLNGGSGAKIKETGGAFALRDNADALYVDLTVDDLTCATINGISAAALASTVGDTHTHVNFALLETYTQTEVNLADAVTKKHTQNTDTGTTSETFQMNNTNPGSSAKIKVDDLTPTFVDIRNAADSAFAPIRASQFRGDLGANNADLNLPLIRYNDGVTDVWEFSNDGVNFYPLQAPALTLAGNAGTIQWNNTTNLGADNTFYYNDTTDTLYVSNLNVSGLILGTTAVSGTVSDTWTINTDGNGLTIDTTGLSGDVTITATELDDAVTNTHAAATVLDSASVDFTLVGQQITAAVLPAGVDHNSLNNYSANRHIDHTAVSISPGTGLTGGGDISANRTLSLSHLGIEALTDPNADRIIFWDDSATATGWLTLGTGLSITDTTINAHAAVTVTDSSSVDLQLSGQDITAVVLPAGVDHDSLNNFVANEHIDHTTVSITAGTGLTGGGNISASRTVSLSHLGIESLSDPNANRLIGWDDTDGSMQWIIIGTGLSYDQGTNTISATGTVTDLDSAYNGGNAIDVDGSPVTLTVSDTDNNRALDVVQNDTTNNPDALLITNAGSGAALKISGAGSQIYIQEQAAADGDTAGYGQIWVKNDAPCTLWFTDDTGVDTQLGGGGATLTRATFTNANLTAGVLTITHSKALSAPYTVMVTIFDNNYQQIIPDSITGATNSVAVDLSSYVTAGGGSITGTWGYGYIA